MMIMFVTDGNTHTIFSTTNYKNKCIINIKYHSDICFL